MKKLVILIFSLFTLIQAQAQIIQLDTTAIQSDGVLTRDEFNQVLDAINLNAARLKVSVDSLGTIVDLKIETVNTANIADDAVTQSKLADALLTYLLSRANHTGSQAISTITGLQTELNAKLSIADTSQLVQDSELTWNQVLQKPDEFTPAAHTHTAGDINTQSAQNGYVLTSDGAGNASWQAVPGSGGGSIPDDNSVTTAKIQDGAVTQAKINSAALSYLLDHDNHSNTPVLGTLAALDSVDWANLKEAVKDSVRAGVDLSSYVQSGDNVSELVNDAGYITSYTVTEGDVTQHEDALTITTSQISDAGDLAGKNEIALLDIPDGLITEPKLSTAVQTKLNAAGGDGLTQADSITLAGIPLFVTQYAQGVDIGDGESHPLSELIPGTFDDLADAQTYYPNATATTNEIAGLAIQKAFSEALVLQASGDIRSVVFPEGLYFTTNQLRSGNKIPIIGLGSSGSRIKVADGATGVDTLLRLDQVNSTYEHGQVVKGIRLDGNHVTDYILHTANLNENAHFDDVVIANYTVDGVLFTTPEYTSTGRPLNFYMNNLWIQGSNVNPPTGHGIHFKGGAGNRVRITNSSIIHRNSNVDGTACILVNIGGSLILSMESNHFEGAGAGIEVRKGRVSINAVDGHSSITNVVVLDQRQNVGGDTNDDRDGAGIAEMIRVNGSTNSLLVRTPDGDIPHTGDYIGEYIYGRSKIRAYTNAMTPLEISGTSGSTGDLFKVNRGTTEVFSVDYQGKPRVRGTYPRIYLKAIGDLSEGHIWYDQTTQTVRFSAIADAGTVPTGTDGLPLSTTPQVAITSDATTTINYNHDLVILTLDENTTFGTLNAKNGRTVQIIVVGGASSYNVSIPTGSQHWKPEGLARVVSVAPGERYEYSLTRAGDTNYWVYTKMEQSQ